MPRRLLTRALVPALACSLLAVPGATTAAATGPANLPDGSVHSVRLIGERIVPNGLDFRGTTVGGLSSIDYDPRTGGYVLICDDRSALQPARFYTADLPVRADGLGQVSFTGTHPLRRPDGTTYPPLTANDPALPQNEQTIDPEELRVDPWTGNYVWSQEGERTTANTAKPGSPATLIDPSVRVATRDGRYLRDLPIPANERMRPASGPRQNLGLEAISFAALGSLILTPVEAPLLQDGPESSTTSGSLSRITLSSRFGPVLAQYAYPQEPVFAAPNPPGAFSTTGVDAVLAVNPVDPTRFLIMERSFVTGVGNKIRIFEIDTRGATNILGVPSLGAAKHVQPVRKRLVADLANLPGGRLSTVDNVEGMTWGPPLPGGERSLILVSDNNFADTQITQFIALGVR